jgi:hypothetical protein
MASCRAPSLKAGGLGFVRNREMTYGHSFSCGAPLLRHALDAVTEHRASVLVDRPLDDALVVVDE